MKLVIKSMERSNPKKLEEGVLYYFRSYIALLMKGMGLRSVLAKKFVKTKDSNHSLYVVNDNLNRNFTSLQLVEKGVSDIAYIQVNKEWNYLTTIMGLADRKIVGWYLMHGYGKYNL